jgi:hypothetical protein
VPITTAGTITGLAQTRFDGALGLTIQASITGYVSGGTTIDLYLQTSLDSGATWQDVANFHWTTANAVKNRSLSKLTVNATDKTPGSLALTVSTSVDGIFGDQFRWVSVSVGTYVGPVLTATLIPS